MEVLSFFGVLTKSLPAAASIVFSLLAIFLAFYLQRRKINIEEKTSITSSQQKQIDSLMQQITLLSDELEKTRDQLSELHNQNVQLMGQLREANKRIGELETLLMKHQIIT